MLTIFSTLLDFFLPKQCVYCGLFLNSYLCANCRNKIHAYKPECFVTRLPSPNWEILPDHRANTNFTKVFYFYKYNPVIHDLITAIKYGFQYSLAETVFELIIMSKEFQALSFDSVDLITYVPLTKQRQQWRGFNQSEILAGTLAKFLSKPYCQMLEKARTTKNQVDLDREQRLTNLQGAYSIKRNLPITIDNQVILLVDDICTTGSTLEECASTLRKSYPGIDLYGLCFARGE